MTSQPQQMLNDTLFTTVIDSQNLLAAWEKVEENAGGPGVSETLENYGTRVQERVFECHLTPAQREEVQDRLARLIEPEVDNVRYYRVCQDCLAQSAAIGPVPLTTDPDYYLVG